MEVGIIVPPRRVVTVTEGAASIHVAHLISLLRQCGVTTVRYADYNTVPFHIYSQAACEIAEGDSLPSYLFQEERLAILTRMVLDHFLCTPSRLGDLFPIPDVIVENLAGMLEVILKDLLSQVALQRLEALILVVSPSIMYALVLCMLAKSLVPDLPIILVDNYTFEPATPYVLAPLSSKDISGGAVGSPLSLDPSGERLRFLIPQLVDWVIVGEGYDVIPYLFGSSGSLSATMYQSNGRSETVRLQSPLLKREHPQATAVVVSNPVNLDSLPLPDYRPLHDHYEAAEIEITRGCPYQCSFCERSGMFDGHVFSHSSGYVSSVLSQISRHHFSLLTFIDCAVNINSRVTSDTLQQLTLGGLDIPYQVNLRSKETDPRLMRCLKETGCGLVAIGVESGDRSVLGSMNKGQDLEQLKSMARDLGEHDLPLMVFLILGFPTETKESVMHTCLLMEKLATLCNIYCVEIELYHFGHIQRLRPSLYQRYGLRWTAIAPGKPLESSSRIYTEPGFYGMAHASHGMDRSGLNCALREYRDRCATVGIERIVHSGAKGDA